MELKERLQIHEARHLKLKQLALSYDNKQILKVKRILCLNYFMIVRLSMLNAAKAVIELKQATKLAKQFEPGGIVNKQGHRAEHIINKQ